MLGDSNSVVKMWMRLCINVSVCVNVCVHTGANTHEVYNLLKVIGKDHV